MPGGRGTRTTDSMMEALRGIMQDLAYIQTLPDADLDFITNLQQQVLDRVRAPIQAAMQGSTPQAAPSEIGALGGGGGMGGGMAAQLGMPEMPMTTQPATQVPAGMRNGGSMPPVDELRRLLGSTAGA